MSDAEQMVRDFYASEASLQTERMLALCSEDFRYEDIPSGTVTNGKDQFRDEMDSLFRSMSGVEIELKSCFALGDWAAVEWVFSATQTGVLVGLPSAGRSFSLRGASILELRKDRIKSRTDYWDMASIVRQLVTAD